MQLARKCQPSLLPQPLRLTAVAVLICATLTALHCTTSSAEDVLVEKAIAASPVQTLSTRAVNYEMPERVALNMYEPPQADFLANYSRTADGQWHIPRQVDRANPWLRLMILGTERPTLIDVAIYIDGEPYTTAREKLIDGLMDHATLESLVRAAVDVPVPEDSRGAEIDNEEKPEPETLADESVDKKSSDTTNEDNSETVEPKQPLVEVKRRTSHSIAQRLVNYMASTDVKADREEIRWLMAEWTGGPALLTLGPAMNWQRVSFAPLWNTLDVDGDQSLSITEIAAAAERLAQADVDENSIIELEELFSMHTSKTTAPHSYPLVVVIDYETDWQQLNSHLQAAYGRREAEPQGSASSATSALLNRIAQGNSAQKAGDLKALIDEEADIKLRVTLGGTDQENQLALLSSRDVEISGNEKMVTVVRGAEYFEFSAGEAQKVDATDPAATQISIGAVVDGYPLCRLLDRNGDRRLSPRECRNLKHVLAALDLDGDGVISARERPTAIRIAVARGPHAHEMLAEPISAAREFASSGQTTAAPPPTTASSAKVPAWFTEMDRNGDGDVSRSEFLGTLEQFKELDRDQDGLISSQEASE